MTVLGDVLYGLSVFAAAAIVVASFVFTFALLLSAAWLLAAIAAIPAVVFVLLAARSLGAAMRTDPERGSRD